LQKAGESSLRFNLRRFWGFTRVLLKNRMSAVGLILMIFSASMVVAAVVYYPKNPQQIPAVGGSNVPPEWMSYFPEGYYLSRNMIVGSDPTFSAPSALQEWNYQYNSASEPYLSIGWSPEGQSSGGSLLVSSTSSSVLNMSVVKTFFYPYQGPPQRFTVTGFEVQAHGLNGTRPVQLQLFLQRANGTSYTLWSTPLTQNNIWISPQYPVDSANSALASLTASRTPSQITFAQDVFSQTTNYTIGVSLSFPASRCTSSSPCSINITNLGLQLYGTSFGLLGTDFYGADLLGQLLWGAKVSLFVGLVAAAIGIFLGLVVGLIAGYKTGFVDEALMRFTDAMLVLPALPLLLVLITVLGPSLLNIIILIGFLGWMGFARVIRSQVLSLKERPFIEAAKASGAGTGRILTTHIFPNVVSLTYVNLALAVPGAILTEAALSFLGLGDPQSISWGQILERAQELGAFQIWWWIIPPGLAIAMVSLSFVLIGYALDEIFNPKLRKRR
jgi:peptide/nickel transport system permease protein